MKSLDTHHISPFRSSVLMKRAFSGEVFFSFLIIINKAEIRKRLNS